MNGNRRCSIVGISVEGLFGAYDYQLGSHAGTSFNPQLLLFYGDNGCGKTTILRLIYHTLSPEPNRGHRTSIVKIPVRRFVVTLVDRTEIEIRRSDKSLVGPYSWHLRRPNRADLQLNVQPDAEGKVKRPSDPIERARWEAFEAELLSLGMAVYFLPDDRKPASESLGANRVDVDATNFDTVATFEKLKRANKPPAPSILEVTVSQLVNLLRTQAIAAGQTGEASINQIYASVVRRLLWTKGRESVDATSPHDVSKALRSLMARSEPFAASGLMPRLDFSELLAGIEQEDATTNVLIARVLQPYIDSITARLNALASIQELIETLVRLLDSFYAGKRATFDMRVGLEITQASGKPLPFDVLSSGEKQLLLLFCNTIRARSQATIFVIDEPELSLNVKWQRQLLESLLTLVKGSSVQFAIATHSIELMAGQRESIVRLNPGTSQETSGTWNDERSPS